MPKKLGLLRKYLAINLRKHRKLKKLSQDELSELANLFRTYVGAVERAERNISVDNVERLANALKVDVSELFVKPEKYLVERLKKR